MLPNDFLKKGLHIKHELWGQVLRAVAGAKVPAIRRRFYQLRVMEFLGREVGLEFEAAQQSGSNDALLHCGHASAPSPGSGSGVWLDRRPYKGGRLL